jgi:DNA-binding SARP family transcriptional activator
MDIHLITFGRLRCLLDDEELIDLPHQRSRCALLVYLAIEREASRESLYNLFWSDRDDEKARGALKQSLYELRRQLGADWIDPRPDPLTISALVRTDAADFEAAVQSGQLTAALELYRGDFLREFSLPNCKEFEFWVDRKRAHYARLHRTARRKRIAELMDTSAASDALLVARRWVELEPQDDEAQHKFIELLAATGERAEALRQYESYERQLAADQLQPLEQTVALVAALRAANSDDSVRLPVAAAGSRDSQSTLTISPTQAQLATQQDVAAIASRPKRARWSAGRIAAVIVPAFVLVALPLVLKGPRDASHIRSVAVLPFYYQGPKAEDMDWLREGLADELMTSLDQIDGLRVAPRTSAFAFQGRDVGLSDIARKLNVDGIVEPPFVAKEIRCESRPR